MNTNTYYIKANIKSLTTKLKLTNSNKCLDVFGFHNQTKTRLLFLNVKVIPQSKKS